MPDRMGPAKGRASKGVEDESNRCLSPVPTTFGVVRTTIFTVFSTELWKLDEFMCEDGHSGCTLKPAPHPARRVAMPDSFAFRILVVDDEPSILTTLAAVLSSKGYEVRTASGGFAALAKLRRALPDVIISDLRMSDMNGFELLSVIRRRFPQIAVIAIGGEYDGSSSEVLADAFFKKGAYSPEELFNKITELLQQSPLPTVVSKTDKAPVWIPKKSTGYFIVTCPECLRSFSVDDQHSGEEIEEAECVLNTRHRRDGRRNGPRCATVLSLVAWGSTRWLAAISGRLITASTVSPLWLVAELST